MEIVATVSSPYKERFGIPRQPGLVNAHGKILMQPGFDDPAMLDGLQEFSHIWVLFQFHASMDQGWKKKTRPPRLGGKKQVGLFASRSPHRPNGLGLSVLKVEEVHARKPVHIRVSGLDLLDGTPIVDIKPYVTYTDALPDALSGFANKAPEKSQQVVFTEEAETLLAGRPNGKRDRQFIADVLALDPRPAYKQTRKTERLFGMLLGDYEVKWQVEGRMTKVMKIIIFDKNRNN